MTNSNMNESKISDAKMEGKILIANEKDLEIDTKSATQLQNNIH